VIHPDVAIRHREELAQEIAAGIPDAVLRFCTFRFLDGRHHAAALALLGRYLMVLPLQRGGVNLDAPLRS
jgi:hypothetical protein